MRYVLFICTDPTAEPYVEAEDNAGEWVASLQDSGSYVLGDRLRPVEDATSVRVRAGERIVADGPFTESREWIAGFDVIDADDLDAAIEIAAAHPMARFGLVEVRPVWPLGSTM
ncbi:MULTISPECIES: YciI family protein [unclassified Microbacterium]|uniref:YciI family protein n=1 Tax=unclassified Microbacterium TaxID=2609290 RepID=UPI0021A778E5|nr:MULTISPECIES: YciI family protein [unclassified Microbacterium]MCT1363574.1 YciI family protein [Microbacterium sp. p3-SID131]MCT1375535.1 YciI family protein [Microbacterium sp. p3-SID337]